MAQILSSARNPEIAPRVIVKFKSEATLPYSMAAHAEHARMHAEAWGDLAARYAGVSLRPYFAMVGDSVFRRLQRRASAARWKQLGLKSYFAVSVPPGVDPAVVAKEVGGWNHVEFAHVEGEVALPNVQPDDDPLSYSQGYLNARPVGIDARWAWESTPVDGSGASIVDLESGWLKTHEDLPQGIPIIVGENNSGLGHGAAVLGILVAVDDKKGVVGIAPKATVRLASQYFDGVPNTAAAIILAIDQMQRAEILLLEITLFDFRIMNWLPAEIYPQVFDLIHFATHDLGIIVFEPTGSLPGLQGVDLDLYEDFEGKLMFNRGSPDFRDSGAIIVSAAFRTLPHGRIPYAHYGSRIDCFAWGNEFRCCSDGDKGEGHEGNPPEATYGVFGGASGATAIVAGAALLIQSLAIREGFGVLDPDEMRRVLSAPGLNTSSNETGDEQYDAEHKDDPDINRIGVMPDLSRIIVYLRMEKNAPWRWLVRLAWAWTIVLGGIIVTPIGPFCAVCGLDWQSALLARIVGGVLILAGAVGLGRSFAGRKIGAGKLGSGGPLN